MKCSLLSTLHNFQEAEKEDDCSESLTLPSERLLEERENKSIGPVTGRLHIDRADICLFYLFKPKLGCLVGQMKQKKQHGRNEREM